MQPPICISSLDSLNPKPPILKNKISPIIVPFLLPIFRMQHRQFPKHPIQKLLTGNLLNFSKILQNIAFMRYSSPTLNISSINPNFKKVPTRHVLFPQRNWSIRSIQSLTIGVSYGYEYNYTVACFQSYKKVSRRQQSLFKQQSWKSSI